VKALVPSREEMSHPGANGRSPAVFYRKEIQRNDVTDGDAWQSIARKEDVSSATGGVWRV